MKIKLNKYLGLVCHTCYGKRNNIKYFIFVDIDTKDKEILRACMQEVARAGLSFWILETSKGYHIISPNMIDILEWHRLKTSISKFLTNYYVYYVIRVQNKAGDKYIGFYDQWDIEQYPISESLVRLMCTRFKKCRLIKSDRIIPSSLDFNMYSHHEFNDRSR